MSRPSIALRPLMVAQTAMYKAGLGIRNEVCPGCRQIEGSEECLAWIGCQLCEIGFHDDCYWRVMASPDEYRRFQFWEADRSPELLIFLCSGCRS